jgi:hypothetical protein
MWLKGLTQEAVVRGVRQLGVVHVTEFQSTAMGHQAQQHTVQMTSSWLRTGLFRLLQLVVVPEIPTP